MEEAQKSRNAENFGRPAFSQRPADDDDMESVDLSTPKPNADPEAKWSDLFDFGFASRVPESFMSLSLFQKSGLVLAAIIVLLLPVIRSYITGKDEDAEEDADTVPNDDTAAEAKPASWYIPSLAEGLRGASGKRWKGYRKGQTGTKQGGRGRVWAIYDDDGNFVGFDMNYAETFADEFLGEAFTSSKLRDAAMEYGIDIYGTGLKNVKKRILEDADFAMKLAQAYRSYDNSESAKLAEAVRSAEAAFESRRPSRRGSVDSTASVASSAASVISTSSANGSRVVFVDPKPKPSPKAKVAVAVTAEDDDPVVVVEPKRKTEAAPAPAKKTILKRPEEAERAKRFLIKTGNNSRNKRLDSFHWDHPASSVCVEHPEELERYLCGRARIKFGTKITAANWKLFLDAVNFKDKMLTSAVRAALRTYFEPPADLRTEEQLRATKKESATGPTDGDIDVSAMLKARVPVRANGTVVGFGTCVGDYVLVPEHVLKAAEKDAVYASLLAAPAYTSPYMVYGAERDRLLAYPKNKFPGTSGCRSMALATSAVVDHTKLYMLDLSATLRPGLSLVDPKTGNLHVFNNTNKGDCGNPYVAQGTGNHLVMIHNWGEDKKVHARGGNSGFHAEFIAKAFPFLCQRPRAPAPSRA
jgi:hypothetical protein